ncbi:MAG TPA: hypothetical protein VMT52_09030 [Planctomycetota bacterium]|nr:hypothetical protein [Planctomycetota bacterium]
MMLDRMSARRIDVQVTTARRGFWIAGILAISLGLHLGPVAGARAGMPLVADDTAKKDEAAKKEAPEKAEKDTAKPSDNAKPEDNAKKDETAKDGKANEKTQPAAEAVIKILKEKAPAAVPDAPPANAEKAAEEGKARADTPVEVSIEDSTAAPAPSDAPKEPAKAAAAPPKKKKAPEPPMFRLRDGTRLAGTPALVAMNISTPYGKLIVPVAELVHVRFASIKDGALGERLAESIKALGSEEFDRREEAMAAIQEIGVPALDALRKALESEDEEVKSRAEKLISQIEEEKDDDEEADSVSTPLTGDEDEIVTLKFTVRGQVDEKDFALKTRYGGLQLFRKDIISIVFRESPHAKHSFTVPGNTFAGNKQWFETKLALTQGERLHITASGQINLENYGQTTGPEGTTNISGNQLESFPAGALVGKIGKDGKAFLIGSEYEQSAPASGTLQLGVSLQNGQASGQYQVEVEKDSES